LGRNTFAAADLYGRMANICGDVEPFLRRTDLLKQLTGGDVIRAERKFRDAFEFAWRGVPYFSANRMPVSPDQSRAFADRWLVFRSIGNLGRRAGPGG
jgi:putative DNA primase/helicase